MSFAAARALAIAAVFVVASSCTGSDEAVQPPSTEASVVQPSLASTTPESNTTEIDMIEPVPVETLAIAPAQTSLTSHLITRGREVGIFVIEDGCLLFENQTDDTTYQVARPGPVRELDESGRVTLALHRVRPGDNTLYRLVGQRVDADNIDTPQPSDCTDPYLVIWDTRLHEDQAPVGSAYAAIQECPEGLIERDAECRPQLVTAGRVWQADLTLTDVAAIDELANDIIGAEPGWSVWSTSDRDVVIARGPGPDVAFRH